MNTEERKIHPSGEYYSYVVVGLEGGVMTLMSRRVFKTRDDAQHYCESVASSRLPMVVEGRFDNLRIPPNKKAGFSLGVWMTPEEADLLDRLEASTQRIWVDSGPRKEK